MTENFENETENSLPTSANADNLTVSATSAILVEISTGKVLFEKEADQKRSPASITKIMTLLLAMEAISNGNMKLTDKVTASAHASSMGGSQIWLKENETMSVDDILKAIAVASANDASVAIGEHIAGSEEAFVQKMNKRAKELSMNNTNFVNCCGLDVENHYSTARDIAIMSAELLKHDLIKNYSTIWMDSLRGGETELVNTNKLVRFYEGATGLKTGTTDDAGYCVAASAKKGDTELVAVILNGETSDKRFADAKVLLNYGFANFTITTPNLSDIILEPIKVSKGYDSLVEAVLEEPSPILVNKGTQDDIEIKISLAESVNAPVRAGQILGKITYLSNGEVVGESRILAKNSVELLTFWKAFKKLFLSIL
ncbi:MAG: D-alanyl-D-alanine carboxypeptidase [Clostridia bacterium]|nr:D-alanyl-D-alanine carboxypeptidase [Clostridia bacterium]